MHNPNISNVPPFRYLSSFLSVFGRERTNNSRTQLREATPTHRLTHSHSRTLTDSLTLKERERKIEKKGGGLPSIALLPPPPPN
jgi:hypothetical protein